jgi:hypothetical protein
MFFSSPTSSWSPRPMFATVPASRFAFRCSLDKSKQPLDKTFACTQRRANFPNSTTLFCVHTRFVSRMGSRAIDEELIIRLSRPSCKTQKLFARPPGCKSAIIHVTDSRVHCTCNQPLYTRRAANLVQFKVRIGICILIFVERLSAGI